MRSPTAVTSLGCPGCAMTLLLSRAYSINHQELVFHQDQKSIQKMWMTHKTQVLRLLHMQPYSATAAKLLRKVIFILEKAAILKIAVILNIWFRKIKFQIPHSKKYMIWHKDHSNRTNIWCFIQKSIFDAQNGGHLEKWRPSWHSDRLKIFFSKK